MNLNRRKFVASGLALGATARMASWGQLALANDGIRRGDVWSRYMIGTSYYPEQLPREQWAQDFAKMPELGVNIVRMGEFAWSAIEPMQGHFDFAWLDEAISLASKNGIAVILGTPTASIPPWLYKLHPDTLGANEKGPYTYGGRKGFSLESSAMRDAAKQIVSRLAARYGSNDAVVGWQLSNEPGYPMMNFDHNALLAFREWLKARYGSIAKLNSVWSGRFWSNEYDDWDEIVFPVNSAEGGWNPGITLDYRRFFSDSFVKWLRFEEGLIRPQAHNQFLYTNWPDTRWSVNIRDTASFVDAAAWDNYSKMPGTAPYHEVLHSGLDQDLCRCSRADHRYFVAEQPSQTYADVSDKSVRLATYLDLAHGASGTIYFEWRAPAIGSERGYVSMLEADGSFGRSAEQFRQMSQEMAKLNPLLAGAQTKADIALLYSYDNQFAQGSSWTDKQSAEPTYDGVAESYYAGACLLRRNIDVISGSSPLEKYRLVVAPSLQLVGDEQAKMLKEYVQAGGVLVIDHKAGTLDQDGRVRPLIEPGVFHEIAGIRVPAALESHRSGGTCTVDFESQVAKFPVDFTANVELKTATALAHFRGGELDGHAAVTLNAYGKGYVIFVAVGTRDAAFFDMVFELLAQKFSIMPLMTTPPGVVVLSRESKGKEFFFVMNLNTSATTLQLSDRHREVITGVSVLGTFTLPALDVAIFEEERKPL